jgi:hypothetical protein
MPQLARCDHEPPLRSRYALHFDVRFFTMSYAVQIETAPPFLDGLDLPAFLSVRFANEVHSCLFHSAVLFPPTETGTSCRLILVSGSVATGSSARHLHSKVFPACRLGDRFLGTTDTALFNEQASAMISAYVDAAGAM